MSLSLAAPARRVKSKQQDALPPLTSYEMQVSMCLPDSCTTMTVDCHSATHPSILTHPSGTGSDRQALLRRRSHSAPATHAVRDAQRGFAVMSCDLSHVMSRDLSHDITLCQVIYHMTSLANATCPLVHASTALRVAATDMQTQTLEQTQTQTAGRCLQGDKGIAAGKIRTRPDHKGSRTHALTHPH